LIRHHSESIEKKMNDELRILLYQYLTIGVSYDLTIYTDQAEKRFPLLPPEAQKVLELGVGLGRTLFPLHKLGYECVGLDSDRAMLAAARHAHDLEQKTADSSETKLELRFGQINSFLLPLTFGQIQVPLRTLQLLSIKEQQGLLNSTADHLHQDGIALFHLCSAPEQALDGVWRIYKEAPVADGGTMLIEEALYSAHTEEPLFEGQVSLQLRHRFQQFDPTGYSTGCWRLAHQLISWKEDPFAQFAERAGLTEIERIPLSQGDWISVCRRS
jgi:SAM-dependent methyltransferase